MPMVPFEYHSFWDVPRFIVCTVEGTRLLLDASFDDALDEYAPNYRVFALPRELELLSMYDWARSDLGEANYLCSIPVSEIEFDTTKRREIEACPLLKLLQR